MDDPRPVELRKTSEDEIETFIANLKPHQNEKIKHPNGPMWLHTLNKNPDMVTPAPVEREIGKKHALKIYEQFALNTSCFWRSIRSNISRVLCNIT